MRSREARNLFTRLAELSVHRANVQEGQIVLVAAEIGPEEQARATAEAAYKRRHPRLLFRCAQSGRESRGESRPCDLQGMV